MPRRKPRTTYFKDQGSANPNILLRSKMELVLGSIAPSVCGSKRRKGFQAMLTAVPKPIILATDLEILLFPLQVVVLDTCMPYRGPSWA
jgi:hypothetical protein